MASSAAKTQKNPVQIHLTGGGVFACRCRSTEFRATPEDAPPHWFCRCGQIYTPGDLPPLKES